MREILFRGKRSDNGEWVEGCFIKSLSSTVYGYITRSMSDSSVRVHLGTIGQFTGSIDINGKKIYEGDIVKFNRFGYVFVVKSSTTLKHPDLKYNTLTPSEYIKSVLPSLF